MSTAQGPLGYFGKRPAEGDFIRAHGGSPAERALEDFVHAGHAALVEHGLSQQDYTLRFIFPHASSETTLVGTMANSSDKVGRRFPLAYFEKAADVPPSSSASEALSRFAPVFTRAEASLREQGLGGHRLKQQEPGRHRSDIGIQASRRATPDNDLGTMPSGGRGAFFYALQTFSRALGITRSHPAQAPIVLTPRALGLNVLGENIAGEPYNDMLRGFWLDLWQHVHGVTRSRAAGESLASGYGPAALFAQNTASLALCERDTAAPGLFVAALDPSTAHPEVWPLWTERESAKDSAEAALGTEASLGAVYDDLLTGRAPSATELGARLRDRS